jgi:hypothetical protein
LVLYTRPKDFDGTITLSAAVDASYLSEDGSKSRFGYFFFCNGALVSWASQNTTRLVTSSTEAECHGLVHVGKENIWQRELHQSLGVFKLTGPTVVLQDNKSAIALTQGIKVSNKRSKHFGLEFEVLREYVALGEMTIEYKESSTLVADMLTKALAGPKFISFRDLVMGSGQVRGGLAFCASAGMTAGNAVAEPQSQGICVGLMGV